jgi:hypothetical protein
MSLLGFDQSCHDLSRDCSGHPVWRTGFIIKPGHPLVSKTLQPFVGCLSTDPQSQGKFGYGIFSGFVKTYQFQSLFHRTGFLPRQGSTSLPKSNLLPMSLANV